jgi:hypothetical protein
MLRLHFFVTVTCDCFTCVHSPSSTATFFTCMLTNLAADLQFWCAGGILLSIDSYCCSNCIAAFQKV